MASGSKEDEKSVRKETMLVASMMRRFATTALALVLALALVPAVALANPTRAADIASGTSNTCSWTIDAAGALVIAPSDGASGTLDDYTRDDAPWLAHRDAIKSVAIKSGVKANGGLVGIFSRCPNLASVDLSGLDSTNATNMANMFYSCTALKQLDLTGLNTVRVETMNSMFNSCRALESLNLAGFNTANVSSMSGMFAGCSSLTKLDLSSFNTWRATNMSGMFEYCTMLKEVRLGSSFSFKGAKEEVLTELPGGNWLSAALGYTFTAADLAAQRNDTTDSYTKVTTPIADPDTYEAMFRLYNPNSGEHFYTSSTVERDHLISVGWNDEGTGWTAPKAGDAVYRLYNPYAGEHHYTLSTVERDSLIAAGWNDEGIGWRSDPAQRVALYRVYNPNEYANNHHYTKEAGERDILLSKGWQDEGTAWYGIG